jgi:hypothetical protein
MARYDGVDWPRKRHAVTRLGLSIMAPNNATTLKRKRLSHTRLDEFIAKASGQKNTSIHMSFHPNRRPPKCPLGDG